MNKKKEYLDQVTSLLTESQENMKILLDFFIEKNQIPLNKDNLFVYGKVRNNILKEDQGKKHIKRLALKFED